MAALDEILEQALALSFEERVRLVEALNRSLDPPGDDISSDEWHAAWSKEIARRVEDLRDNKIELIGGDVAMAQVRARLAPK